jgi:hypothetical protein
MTDSLPNQTQTLKSESPDPGTDSMFERTLKRTPAQRLSDAARIARFVLHTREKVRAATDG